MDIEDDHRVTFDGKPQRDVRQAADWLQNERVRRHHARHVTNPCQWRTGALNRNPDINQMMHTGQDEPFRDAIWAHTLGRCTDALDDDDEIRARATSTWDVCIDTLRDTQPQQLIADLDVGDGAVPLTFRDSATGALTMIEILIQDGDRDDRKNLRREENERRKQLQTALTRAGIDATIHIFSVNAGGAVAPGNDTRLARQFRIPKELSTTLVTRICQNMNAQNASGELFELYIEEPVQIECPWVAAPQAAAVHELPADPPVAVPDRLFLSACTRRAPKHDA